MTGSSTSSSSSWMLLPMLLALFVISSFSAPAPKLKRSITESTNELEQLKDCSSKSSKTLNISVSQLNSSIEYFTEGIKLLKCEKTLVPVLLARLHYYSQGIVSSGCLTERNSSLIKPEAFFMELKRLLQCYNYKPKTSTTTKSQS